MDSIDITPSQRKIIISLLTSYIPGVTVWAYGSRVKWTSRPESDLDLIAYSASEQQGRISELKEAFDNSSLPFRIDLLVWDDVPENIRQNVLKEYVVLVEKACVREGDQAGGSFAMPVVRLGDYCLKIGSGATPRGGKSVYLEHGEVSLFRSQNIYNDGFHEDGLAYIDQKAANDLENVAIEENDILLNITGDSVARVCLAPAKLLPARVNQHVAIIRPHSSDFDSRYLRYFLLSPSMQDYLLLLAGAGATRNALTKGMIENLKVPKPDLSVQKQIADVLSSLDDKIELNRRINQTLEQIAQTIFKSWFVDFDPVKAKIRAKTSLTQTLSQRERAELPSPFGRGAGGEGNIRGEGKKLPPKLLAAARDLRKNQTNAEKLLWQMLRNSQLADCKFRRQHPVGKYILDFYCHEKKLAVELDGGQHNEPEQRKHDEERTDWLKEQGIEVLRFWNNDVLQKTEAVMEEIYWTLTQSPLTQTLSQGERAKLPSPFGRGVGGEGKESEDINFSEKALKDPIERAAMCAISGKSEAELDQLPAETLEQLAAIAALFPDELVESELGLIPKGWGKTRIEDVYYLLQTLGLDNMNTDAAVPGLNRNNVYRLLVPNVDSELVDAFTIIIQTLREKIALNNKESKYLTEIRDSLLPKLLSGKIKLKEAKHSADVVKQEVL